MGEDPTGALQRLFPAEEGWEVDVEEEGGQPNGILEIERSDTRGWFSDAREDHHRFVYTITGPWQPGARDSVRERVQRAQEELARRQAHEEEETLRKAQEILTRRAAEGGYGRA